MMLTTSGKIIVALVAVILLMGAGFFVYKDHADGKMVAANNQLAALIPMQRVNDSLVYRIASMVPAEELKKHLDKESQLAKAIKERDERILVLASAAFEIRRDSFPVPIVHIMGLRDTFNKEDRWMTIAGIIDSNDVFITTLQARDSITLAITQAKEGILYGRIANHSPYNTVTNAEFAIDSKLYFTPPWFRFGGIGIVGGATFPGGYLGVDVRATLWDQLELSPRFVTQGNAFNKALEVRWRLPFL